jgi:hypothetical protein
MTQCVELACNALLDAIREYSNAARDDWAGDEALICTCFFVSERTIEREIQTRAHDRGRSDQILQRRRRLRIVPSTDSGDS